VSDNACDGKDAQSDTNHLSNLANFSKLTGIVFKIFAYDIQMEL